MSAEIRCPMCGKPNPADAEVCQFCGARLRPIRPGEEPKPEDSPTSQPISDEWDLLQGGQSEGHPQAEEKAAETPQAAEEDLPDWMKELGGETEDEEEEELPDWLSELGLDELGAAEEPSTAEAEPKPAAAAPAEELPDWLDELGAAEEPPTTEAEPEPAAAAPAEELPDWLDELGAAEEPSTAEAEPEPAAAAHADELPDWLDELGVPEELSPTAEAEPEPAAAALAEELPDWLDELGAAEEPSTAEAEPETAAAAPAEELPDWLDELGAAEEPSTAEAEPETAAAAPAEELPDWLDELGVPEELSPTAEAEPETAAAAPAEELPDWLDELGVPEELSPTAEAEPETAAAAPAEELPDWLDELGGETEEDLITALGQPEESETADEALPEGELPAWVEAMRPVEISPEELGINEPVESTGPLAGLRGVIPPAPPTTTPKQKIGVTSSRLTLSEEEENRLKAITELLQEEFSPKKLPKKRKKVGGRILHRLFGLVLLVVAFLPLLLPSLQAPLPNKALPSALAAKRLIDKVPPKGVVLVGVDYNLGFSAELEAAATPALAQLIGKGVRLVAISTNPVGGGMAERLIENASAGKTYREGTDYLNLGYLPGGTAALYAFARSPRAVLPSVLRYKNVWNSAILQKIKTANDFDLVLVITEDPDTARSWIEQVQPALKTTPLVMVISAQAEPLVAPYYETARHQVGGIITGLESGVAYREMAGQSATQKERGIWSSYSLITLTVVVLMALGGLYAWILGLIDRKHRSAEVEE